MSPEHFGECLICPICDTKLSPTGNTLKCGRKHSFDVGREGYINLLVPTKEKLAEAGDTQEMLVARRAFLDKGFYAPLSASINELVTEFLTRKSSGGNIIDAGCGEGYYIGRLKQGLDNLSKGSIHSFFGLDVSKYAARIAARRYRGVGFIVGNINQKLPLADESVEVLINVFAPRNPAEFGRVLAPGGLVLTVIPNPSHLIELRSSLKLLHIEEDKYQHTVNRFENQFDLIGARSLEYELLLTSGDDLANLVKMTPNYWHTSREDRLAMDTMSGCQTKASFNMLSFRKR